MSDSDALAEGRSPAPRRKRKRIVAASALFLLCALTAALLIVWPFRRATPLVPSVCAAWARAEAVSEGFGWDLTYKSLLYRTGMCPGQPICDEWLKPEPPIKNHLAEWQNDPVISSVEFEFPDGHASMSSTWFIRTKEQAYVRAFYPLNEDNDEARETIPVELYDRMFETMACWEQDEPEAKIFGCSPPGYMGFLSLYREGKSRQMLVTCRDVFIKNAETGEETPGRFSEALRPIAAVLDARRKESGPDAKKPR